MALATGLLSERTGQIRLADAGRAGNQDVVMLDNPASDGELPDHGAIQAASRGVVEIFETRVRNAQLRLLQSPRQRAIVAKELLGVDEHAEALVEGEGRHRRILVLRDVGVGHGAQAQRAESVAGHRHHEGSPSW